MTLEQERPKITLEKISLNQEFILFDPKRTNIEGDQLNLGSMVVLETGILPGLEIVMITLDPNRVWPTDKLTTITPFKPNLGYQITGEDFNSKPRITKILQLLKELSSQEHDLTELSQQRELLVGTDSSEVKMFEFVNHEDAFFNHFRLKPEVLAVLKRLRVQLFFPTSSFESKLEFGDFNPKFSLPELSVDFEEFYPLDKGPLPVNTRLAERYYVENEMRRGFSLAIPRAVSLNEPWIGQIRAKFILKRQ